ncbi:hypothetical protein EG332_15235 [Pectobacterium versatile]|nr:hypothetical protein EG332_15235 [Pectobacterium versatile]
MGIGMKKIAIATLLVLLSGCDRKSEAPFGVEWNDRSRSVSSLGLPTFNKIPLRGDWVILYVTTPPKESFNIEGAYNFLYKNDRLKRITFNTYDLTGLDSIDKSKHIYNELKKILTERYGTPKEVNEHVYNDDFSFFPCVTNTNCGKWESVFSHENYTGKLYIGMGESKSGYSDRRVSGRVHVEFSLNGDSLSP